MNCKSAGLSTAKPKVIEQISEILANAIIREKTQKMKGNTGLRSNLERSCQKQENKTSVYREQ
jgi:hypothetical protein